MSFNTTRTALTLLPVLLTLNGCSTSTSSTKQVADTGQDAGWQPVGGTEVAPGAANSGVIAVSNGVPYAAFTDFLYEAKLTVMKLSGSTWTAVGTRGFTSDPVANFALYVDNGTPYVAIVDTSTQVTVLKYSGGTWGNVCNAGFASTYYSHLTLAVASGTPYLAFADSTDAVRVMSCSGSTWADIGGSPVTTSGSSVAFAIFEGLPYVAFSEYVNSDIQLMKFDTTGTWVTVATAPYTIDEDYDQNLVVSGNALYLSFYNGTYGAVFLELNGATLEPIGTLGDVSSGDSIESVSGLVFNGVPYVAFDDESRDSDPQPRAATVKYYNNGSWQLFAGYPDSCDIEDTYLAADEANGKLYLTYSDCNGNMTVTVH